MYELMKVTGRTYYIDCPAKIGIYLDTENEIYLIDTGNDKETGKKIQRIVQERGWRIKAVINTHSNADHVGGNKLLEERLGCSFYTTELEAAFTKYPALESSFLYGGYPCKALRNKFLLASPSNARDIADLELPKGMEILRLPGHFFQMIGIKTPDDVYFVADSVFSADTIEKYHIFFIYDVEGYLRTLDMLESLQGKWVIPSHGTPTEDIGPLVRSNKEKVRSIEEDILEICKTPICFDDILKEVFDCYGLTMDFNQHVLVGSTIKSYLSYLYDKGRAGYIIEGNKLLWHRV